MGSAEASQQNEEEAVVEKPDDRDENPDEREEAPGEVAELPEGCDVEPPGEVPCDDDVTKMSFSDDDMDMNVDFDLGAETGDDDDDDYANDVGGEPDDDDDDADVRGAPEERMDTDTATCPETKDQTNQMDSDSSRVTAVPSPGKITGLWIHI